ncbi:DUF4312 family protein [Paenibacillus sp. 481]|uniref:DUF4312 family protein n=1 Tax=Paenibacillus sp. 481 TaxID=2835869 RepID=UPI001E2AAC0B|nr:DUF4312 family protein [Paenibacillus sp. 481]UHA74249.1 DUF4312 family protein [Paenibacillus sp. 481]
MYREKELTLALTGKGDTKLKAFQSIFSQVKTTVAKQNPDVLLRIEPMDVEVVSAKALSYTERFLGFLFPRRRTIYELSVKVKVQLRYVSLSDIEFEAQEESLTKVQRVLRMR